MALVKLMSIIKCTDSRLGIFFVCSARDAGVKRRGNSQLPAALAHRSLRELGDSSLRPKEFNLQLSHMS